MEDEELEVAREDEELEAQVELGEDEKLENYTLNQRLQIARFCKNVFDASLVKLLSENCWKLAGLNLTGDLDLEKQNEEKEGKARLKTVMGEFLSFINDCDIYGRLQSWHDIILQFVSMEESGRLKLEYEGYDLVPMLDEDKEDKIEPEFGKLYVKKIPEQKAFKYITINPSGKKVTGIITKDQLKHDIPESFTPDKLRPFLPAIQRITAERGDTYELKSILYSPVMNIPNIFQWLLEEFIGHDKIEFNAEIRAVLNDFVAELNPIIQILTWLQANLCAEPDNILKDPLSSTYVNDPGSFPKLKNPKNKPPKIKLSAESKYSTTLTAEVFQLELTVLKNSHKHLRKEHIDKLEPFLETKAAAFAKQTEFLRQLAGDAETPDFIKQKIALLLNAKDSTLLKQVELLAKLVYDAETPLFIKQKIALLTNLSEVSSSIKKEIESLLSADASTFISLIKLKRNLHLMKLVDWSLPSPSEESSNFTARTFFIEQKIYLLEKLANNAKLPIDIKKLALLEMSWTKLENATQAAQISLALHGINQSMIKDKDVDEKLEGDLPQLRAYLQRSFLPRVRTLKNTCDRYQVENPVFYTGLYFNDHIFKTTVEEQKELQNVEVNIPEFEKQAAKAKQDRKASFDGRRKTLTASSKTLKEALLGGSVLSRSTSTVQSAAVLAQPAGADTKGGTAPSYAPGVQKQPSPPLFPAVKKPPQHDTKGTSSQDHSPTTFPHIAGAAPPPSLRT